MLTKRYWLKVAERAVKTAAQSGLLYLGADQLNALEADYIGLGGFMLGGALLSLLTSLATTPFGDGEDPGLA